MNGLKWWKLWRSYTYTVCLVQRGMTTRILFPVFTFISVYDFIVYTDMINMINTRVFFCTETMQDILKKVIQMSAQGLKASVVWFGPMPLVIFITDVDDIQVSGIDRSYQLLFIRILLIILYKCMIVWRP